MVMMAEHTLPHGRVTCIIHAALCERDVLHPRRLSSSTSMARRSRRVRQVPRSPARGRSWTSPQASPGSSIRSASAPASTPRPYSSPPRGAAAAAWPRPPRRRPAVSSAATLEVGSGVLGVLPALKVGSAPAGCSLMRPSSWSLCACVAVEPNHIAVSVSAAFGRRRAGGWASGARWAHARWAEASASGRAPGRLGCGRAGREAGASVPLARGSGRERAADAQRATRSVRLVNAPSSA